MMHDRFKFRMWDGFGNKMFDEETDPLYENVYECVKQQIFYESKNPLYGMLAYNHNKDGRIFEQCTGVRDKDRKLIYEGDIITCGDDRKWVVIWDDTFWQLKELRKDGCINTQALAWAKYEDIEIIGNIHQNKEC